MAVRPALLAAFAILCLASAARGARVLHTGFVVQGKVFCDTCLAGFETSATTYLTGAKVRLECRERASGDLKYSAEGATDAIGMYHIPVAGEHADQICESILLSSSDVGCAKAVPGRDRARVVLTHNNGIPSNKRLANSMGFQRESAIAGCAEVMQVYQQEEDV